MIINVLTSNKKFSIKFFILIALASVALNFLIVMIHHAPINVDGILYLEVAKIYLQSGLRDAMLLYPWPFYSILIAYVHHFTSSSLFFSAFILNTSFITLAVLGYLFILNELEASKAVVYWGVATILSYSQFNLLRADIIRDAGYWAFLLLGIWQLLRFVKQPRLINAIFWGILMLIASLFRIEGAILFCITPLLLLFQERHSWKNILLQLCQTYIVFIIIIITVLAWLLVHGSQHVGQLGRIKELLVNISFLWLHLKQNFVFTSTLIGNHFPTTSLNEHSDIFLLSGLSGLFIYYFLRTFTILYVLLAGYGLYKSSKNINHTHKLLLGFTVFNFIIPLLFYAQDYIVTSRYLISGCLLLLIWVPFGLKALYCEMKDAPNPSLYRWIFKIVLLAWILFAISGIVHFGTSKVYIREAGEWLQQNIDSNKKIYSNSREVLFYADRSTKNWHNDDYLGNMILTPLKTMTWKSYDYLAIRENHNDEEVKRLINQLAMKPIKTFSNKRNDRVIIFYVTH